MNNRIFPILEIIILCISMLFVACQATPQDNIVVNKNDNALASDLDTLEGENQIITDYPKRWKAMYEKYGGRLIMDIDADIVVPEQENFTVVEIREKFTEIEQVNKFVAAIFGGQRFIISSRKLQKSSWKSR